MEGGGAAAAVTVARALAHPASTHPFSSIAASSLWHLRPRHRLASCFHSHPRFFPRHRHILSLLPALFPSLPLLPRCPRHPHFPSAAACISSIAFAGSGGGGRGIGGGSSGGGGGPGSGDGFTARANPAQALGAEPDDVSRLTPSEDVIFLDVGGMSCGGCASSVKKILESQPHVILASVNLATETAVVKVSLGPELIQGAHTAKREIGEALAKHLSSCGFKSSVSEEPIGG